MHDDFRFDDHPGKDPAESVVVTLDWFNLCANFWRANERYQSSEFIRPKRATGFSYEATTAGLSGKIEPVWPRTVGETKTDGSVVWTCRVADANGLNVISNPAVSPDPTGGLTCTNVQISEDTKVLVTYAAGVDRQKYDAVCTVTINGVARVGRQRVPVRKR